MIKKEQSLYGPSYETRAFYTQPRDPNENVVRLNDDLNVKAVIKYGYDLEWSSIRTAENIFLSTIPLFTYGSKILGGQATPMSQEKAIMVAVLVHSIAKIVDARVQSARYDAVEDEDWGIVTVPADDNSNGSDYHDISPA